MSELAFYKQARYNLGLILGFPSSMITIKRKLIFYL